MSQERDSHFTGFAKLLYEDFLQLQREDEGSIQEMLVPDSDYPEKWQAKVEQRIAQRAYDLMEYSYKRTGALKPSMPYARPYRPEDIPDMDKWPE